TKHKKTRLTHVRPRSSQSTNCATSSRKNKHLPQALHSARKRRGQSETVCPDSGAARRGDWLTGRLKTRREKPRRLASIDGAVIGRRCQVSFRGKRLMAKALKVIARAQGKSAGRASATRNFLDR